MGNFDLAIIIVLGGFAVAGWMSGFVKKIIALICLGLSLIIATKYGATVGETVFQPMGAGPGSSTTIGFLSIVGIIMLAQSILYKVIMKKIIKGLWNKIGGAVVGLLEGVLLSSIIVIFLSIFLHMPSEETKANSMLYKPIKNFAPRIFDSINTFFPESKDFYQEIFDAITRVTQTK